MDVAIAELDLEVERACRHVRARKVHDGDLLVANVHRRFVNVHEALLERIQEARRRLVRARESIVAAGA